MERSTTELNSNEILHIRLGFSAETYDAQTTYVTRASYRAPCPVRAMSLTQRFKNYVKDLKKNPILFDNIVTVISCLLRL